jgi:hypothetical protein
MKVAFLTNEYPPHVYGGAGVHVEFLTRALAALPPEDSPEMEILCFGDQKEIRPGYQVQGFPTPPPFPSQNAAIGKTLDTLSRGLAMSGTLQYADVLHGHTWDSMGSNEPDRGCESTWSRNLERYPSTRIEFR